MRGVNETQDRVVSAFAIPLMQVLVGVVLFGALVGRQVDLAIFAFLVMAIVGAAKLWSRLAHRRLSCHVTVDRGKVFPGETVSLRIHVENGKLLPVHFRLKLASGHALTLADPQPLGGQAGGLLWFQSATFRFDFMARRRGVHPIGLASFAAGDLLGFFPRARVVQEPQRVVVFPRLVPLAPTICPARTSLAGPGPPMHWRIPFTSWAQGTISNGGLPDTFIGRPARAITAFRKRCFSPPRSER